MVDSTSRRSVRPLNHRKIHAPVDRACYQTLYVEMTSQFLRRHVKDCLETVRAFWFGQAFMGRQRSSWPVPPHVQFALSWVLGHDVSEVSPDKFRRLIAELLYGYLPYWLSRAEMRSRTRFTRVSVPFLVPSFDI